MLSKTNEPPVFTSWTSSEVPEAGWMPTKLADRSSTTHVSPWSWTHTGLPSTRFGAAFVRSYTLPTVVIPVIVSVFLVMSAVVAKLLRVDVIE